MVSPLSATADDWDFDDLMAALSEHSSFSADFNEERSSFFLSRPLKLSGHIIFDSNDRMEKIVTEPFSERIIIDEEAVVIHRTNEDGKNEATHTTRYSLAKYPFLSKAIKAVSNVFSGQRELLEELYHWQLSGEREAWELVLEPRDEDLAEFITSISVRGTDGVITYIHSLEADGDESSMQLVNRTEN
ncbi:MAG: hypothetical protein DHS20C01_24390 [marine bacterium B5-7]|nr:MAG: hypothetical protein DHS20C01_24390 [marine bacterium B5-7]